jgi:hypothetical protein
MGTMQPKCSRVVYSECPEKCAHTIFFSEFFGNTLKNVRNILNVPGFPVFLIFIYSVPKVFPKFSKKIHYGCIFQDILNIPLWNISVASFPCILNFTGWVNYGYFTRNIVKNTLDDPPRNTVGTFFGNILNFPTHFLIRKLPGNTVNGLNTSQAGDISVKLAGKILNVLGIFWVGTG